MPQVIYHRLTPRSTKRKVVFGSIVVACLLVVVAVVSYLVIQDQLAKEDQQAYERATKQVNTLRGKRQYDDAKTAALKYVETARSKDNAAYMLTTLGAIYEEQNEPSLALETYRKAEKRVGRDILGTDMGIARTSQRLGDTQTAIVYYKKCITIMKGHENRTNVSDIDFLEKTVAKLEASS